jgi:hypothetical protein
VDVTINGTIEKHVGRVWNVKTVDERYAMYCQSDVVEEFTRKYPNFKIPSRSLFHKNCCSCVRNPSMQSRYVEDFIDCTCCPRVKKPDLACGVGSERFIPSFTLWKCANGNCLKWKEVARQGFKKNGKQNTQLELTRTKEPVKVVLARLIEKGAVFRKHLATLVQLLILELQKLITVASIIIR